MFETPNPFRTDLSFEEKMAVFKDIAADANAEYEVEFEKIMQYFKRYDPLYLCAFAFNYFLDNRAGIDTEAIEGKIDFPPFYVEILQCLALFQNRHYNAEPLHSNAPHFRDTLIKLNTNLSYSYYGLTQNVSSIDELHLVMLRMGMMLHTLAVRNWAYESQMQSVARDLASIIQTRFRDKLGFDPHIFLDILFGIVSNTSSKLNTHFQNIRKVVKGKTHDEVFDKYEEIFDVEVTSVDQREKMWRGVSRKLMSLKIVLMEHSDLALEKVFTSSAKELKMLTQHEITVEECHLIFEKISLRFGELQGTDKNHIFLNNPVHRKPFIKTDESEYFSVLPYMFSHLSVDLLEGFINTDKELTKYYLAEKGKYLEKKIEDLFRTAFPTAQIFVGSKWKCPDTNKLYENDLLIIVKEFAVIVEAKSGTISPPARRGAKDRLFETLKQLVVAPSEQAIRFETFLKSNPKVHTFKTTGGKSNVFDSSGIKYFIPLGVTLSHLGSIGCNLKKLTEAKIIPNKINELAPSISLTDLEIIFDLLPLQSEKLHYFARRREFDAHMTFQGDELDLIGFYLDTGFNIGEDEFNGSFMNLTLKSKELDPYFMGKEHGVAVKKPHLIKTRYWQDILNVVEERKSPNWLQSSYILLHTLLKDQILFEKKFNELKMIVRKGKPLKKHNWSLLKTGPKRRQYAIIGYPYKNITIDERNDVIKMIVDSGEVQDARGIVIIGCNLDNEHYPYSVLAGSSLTDFFDRLDI
ncbi:hypothetical protein FNO01nite_09390 [Flavobacterium noncentrifugens]|nr:hypothetical protein [Flavobacterium noncentrifugens]GEP50267.1 hypothetical protein FNO01nite_09390 [Flavobacterium noncentrifugens]